jgi:glycosyltransferase involved in cell wall biosynthesis
MVVHQILSGAGPVDAVTVQALVYRELFRSWGWEGRDVAGSIDPRMDGRVTPLRALRPDPQDLLLIHYSAYAPKLRELLALPNRKVLLSHNVTPARWMWDYSPTIAVHCAVGRAQLHEFARAVDVAAGVSEFNASELRAAGAQDTPVIPILFDRGALGAPGAEAPEGPPTILFVGRVAPHKRQDEVIRAFALYRRRHAPDARLVLVGEPLTPPYGEAIAGLGETLAPGAVRLESGLSPGELADRYRCAHAFLCLSEHEGFCIPLLEAFHFGVPVVARSAAAVPEIAGDAALLVGEGDDLDVVAELLALAVADGELRTELARRGSSRLEEYEMGRTAERMRAVLEGIVA